MDTKTSPCWVCQAATGDTSISAGILQTLPHALFLHIITIIMLSRPGVAAKAHQTNYVSVRIPYEGFILCTKLFQYVVFGIAL